MPERNRHFDNLPEQKEKPKKVIIEIGTYEEKSFLNQYLVQLPPGTAYHIVHVDYDILPGEHDDRQAVHLADNSVDEVVMSNVLSDLAYFNFNDKKRIEAFWDMVNKNAESKDHEVVFEEARDEVATFQKIRTVKDVIRVLKPGGDLRIYENYNELHPQAVKNVLEWLKSNPKVEFFEDLEEEKRIQPILEKDNQDKIETDRKFKGQFFREEERPLPRKHNKVYRVIKKSKPPQ